MLITGDSFTHTARKFPFETRLLLTGDTKLFLANVLLSNVVCIVFALAGIKFASCVQQ
jgi:fluoride ion exporter CrcB/FEX